MAGLLTIAWPEKDAEILEVVQDREPGDDFAQFAFPGVRQRAENKGNDHPGLDDGWRAQLFTDAAALSAKRGTWVELAELDSQIK